MEKENKVEKLSVEELQAKLDEANENLEQANKTIKQYEEAYKELVNRTNNLQSLYASVVDHIISNTVVKA